MTARSIRDARTSRTVARLRALLWCVVCVASTLTLRAGEGARLTGRVVDAGGHGVEGAEVIVRSRASNVEQRTLTDPSGSFAIAHLSGACLVEARVSRGARSEVHLVDIGDTDPPAIELRLDRAAYEEQVVVTAEARPQPIDEVGKAIAVVEADEIALRDEVSVAEAVRRVAGVQVRVDGGPGQLASIRIRGLRADATAVLIDGWRFRDTTTTQGDASPFLSNLEVINLDRAEVLRGSASSLYGTNAVGGAVNVVSRVGAAEPGGELQLEGGQLGLVRARGTFNGSASAGRLMFSAGVLQLNVADGIDGHDSTRSSGGQGAVTAQVRPSTMVSGRVWISGDRVDLNTSPSAFETPTGNLGTGSTVEARPLDPSQVARLVAGQPVEFGSATFVPGVDDPDDERRSSFWTGGVRLAHQAGRGFSIDAQYQRLGTDRTYTYRPGGTGFQPFVGSETAFTGSTDTLQVLATKSLGARFVLSGGYEFEREAYDGLERELSAAPNAFSAGTRVSQYAHALLARASVTPASRVHIAASLRAQAFDLNAPRFSPPGTSSSYDGLTFDAPPAAVTGDVAASIGVGSRDTRLWVHVGNAYRAPSLYERFGGGFSADPSTGTVSFTAYGDPQLEPDRYVSMDAGVEQSLGNGRLRATWFQTWVQQLTEFDFSGAIDPATDPYGRFAGYINGDGGSSQGLELEADWRLRSITLNAAYTLTDSTTDKALLVPGFFRTPAVARHTFAVTAAGRLGEHLDVAADLFARSGMYAGLFTQLGTRAYDFPARAKVDLGAGWSWRLAGRRRLRVYARVDNLFDQQYYELGWLAPGATFVGGVTLQY